MLRIYAYGSIIYENGSIMAYRILDADFSDFISSDGEMESSASDEAIHRVKLATPKGNIHYTEHILKEDLSLLDVNYAMRDDVTIFGKGNTALLEIQFNLSDKAIYYQDKFKLEHVTPARSGNIVFLAEEENEANILFQKDITYHTFDIHLPVSLLDRYAGESELIDQFLTNIHHDVSSALTQHVIGINPPIYQVIQEMKNCIYEGLTRRIYLESKAYELIALLYENAAYPKNQSALSKADQEKIHWAASIIQNNLEKPFTIMELSRMVGINQTKLKIGFKTVFNNTVFGYLQDIRMHQAKKYLLDTQLSIQEISMLLGYQNMSNFSIAFKKTHGYSPIRLRNQHTCSEKKRL
ncbi:hypothetical protein GCM10023231_28400 [Olivibacter ginsenosidimutans]|uniref:HTH araC/xylS-type domain-containing protein n=2 Tax=Olivibacter ginsenosidimutans TaxID=1176537 RepID=A0ABP9BRD1_9SPHI